MNTIGKLICWLVRKRGGRRKLEPIEAGKRLAPASSYMFFTSDNVALQWLKDRAYAKHLTTQAKP